MKGEGTAELKLEEIVDVCIICICRLNLTRRKHKAIGVSTGFVLKMLNPFFDDPLALTREDPGAKAEQRWLTVGCDALGRVLTVCYTLRGDNEESDQDVRLISARLATKKERTLYES